MQLKRNSNLNVSARTKCTYTFPTLWAEGEMKEEAGIHGQSLVIPSSEENVPWDPQRGSEDLHAGTRLDRKCMSGPACAPLTPSGRASMGTVDLLRLWRTTEPARESARGSHAAGWGCDRAQDQDVVYANVSHSQWKTLSPCPLLLSVGAPLLSWT